MPVWMPDRRNSGSTSWLPPGRISTTAGSRKTYIVRCSRQVTDPITGEDRAVDERFLRSVEEKIKISDSGKDSFRQEVVRKAMVAFKAGEKFTLDSHGRLHEAVEQYLFEERRDVLRLVTSTARPDGDAEQKISAVQERLVQEYGYDLHSAREALNYVTTLLSQE